VLKGGGGEAERNPAKALAAHLWDREQGRSEYLLPSWGEGARRAARDDGPALLAALWRREAMLPAADAIVRATIAMALIALGRARTPDEADAAATAIWTAAA